MPVPKPALRASLTADSGSAPALRPETPLALAGSLHHLQCQSRYGESTQSDSMLPETTSTRTIIELPYGKPCQCPVTRMTTSTYVCGPLGTPSMGPSLFAFSGPGATSGITETSSCHHGQTPVLPVFNELVRLGVLGQRCYYHWQRDYSDYSYSASGPGTLILSYY